MRTVISSRSVIKLLHIQRRRRNRAKKASARKKVAGSFIQFAYITGLSFIRQLHYKHA